METVYIYGLVDPRDKQIYYVGSTNDMNVRLAGHYNDSADTRKTRWINDAFKSGVTPNMVVLAVVEVNNRFEEEYKWIYLGRAMGWPLTNTVGMKSERHTQLSDGLGATLVVEVDKGLTWQKVKTAGRYIIVDESKWLPYLSLWIAFCGILLSLIFLSQGGNLFAASNYVLVFMNLLTASAILTLFLVVFLLYLRDKFKEK